MARTTCSTTIYFLHILEDSEQYLSSNIIKTPISLYNYYLCFRISNLELKIFIFNYFLNWVLFLDYNNDLIVKYCFLFIIGGK